MTKMGSAARVSRTAALLPSPALRACIHTAAVSCSLAHVSTKQHHWVGAVTAAWPAECRQARQAAPEF